MPWLEDSQPQLTSQGCIDARTALDFLLVGQDRACAITNASCCTCINAPEQEEKSIQKLKEKAIWLSEIDPESLWDLFSQLGPGHWRHG